MSGGMCFWSGGSEWGMYMFCEWDMCFVSGGMCSFCEKRVYTYVVFLWDKVCVLSVRGGICSVGWGMYSVRKV